MISTSDQTRPLRAAHPGTLVVTAWSGAAPGGDMPCLLARSLGDGAGGPEASSAAVEPLPPSTGLSLGAELVDGAARPGLPVSLLVGAGRGVVTMPRLNVRCVPPPPVRAVAVARRGHARLVFTTWPRPAAEPGRAGDSGAPAASAGAEETLRAAAHVLLPARSLRG